MKLVLVVLILSSLPQVVHAEERPAQVADARERFSRAVALVDAEEFGEALIIFEELQQARPHPILLYNIAWCLSRLGQRIEALEQFDAYLESGDESADRQDAAGLERARLAEVLAVADLDVTSAEPADAVEAEPEPVNLEPLDPEPPTRRRLSQGWFWGALGLTLATGAGMAATGAVTMVLSDRWLQEGDVNDRDTGRTFRLVTDILLIAAVVEAVTTLIFGLLTDFQGSDAPELGSTASASPVR